MSTQACRLSTKDYTILEVMLDRHAGRDETLTAILREKIAGALVMFRDDVPPEVVTLGSRVAFQVDDGPTDTRIVAQDDVGGAVGSLLPITNPRGLALLGLGEGQSITIPRRGGGVEILTVEEVVYQPESAKREAVRQRQAASSPVRPLGPVLRVVHSSDTMPEKPVKKVMAPADDGFDDPGPSAA
jgi:regulator of nucleoside diphosphate kinase